MILATWVRFKEIWTFQSDLQCHSSLGAQEYYHPVHPGHNDDTFMVIYRQLEIVKIIPASSDGHRVSHLEDIKKLPNWKCRKASRGSLTGESEESYLSATLMAHIYHQWIEELWREQETSREAEYQIFITLGQSRPQQGQIGLQWMNLGWDSNKSS